ncbi:UPF0481 protein At3g47200-like [Cornus florida]|uniref:UPF0481 protein At3g47200-like n=1 Tax=Cornus florida TaxID=4283 RepID=UPI0028A08BC1|nr:UPF0481 protein At3g47200-like [Cornus florida]
MAMEDELSNSITIMMDDSREKTDDLNQFWWSEPWYPVMHRVQDVFRRQNKESEDVYSPITVSIGPLHRGKKHLLATEAVKVSYMHLLFERTRASQETQRNCAADMSIREDDIRKCFREVQLDDNVSLAEIMLIDGCFLIELLYRNYVKEPDPILWNPFKCYAVHRDLLLLENQIPFFVLEELFCLTVECIPKYKHKGSIPTLTECILSFFEGMMGPENAKRECKGMMDSENAKAECKYERPPHHILHLLHMHYSPYVNEDNWNAWGPRNNEVAEFKFSATQLDIVGVNLKEVVNSQNRFDLKFSVGPRFWLLQRSQLEIPPFYIDESTEPFLRNLIAFEQCSPCLPNIFTSHASLMCILIHTKDDVELLEEAGIIRNSLGSREAVLHIFKDMRKNAVPRNFFYNQLWTELKEFCTPSRTFYTMFSYHHPRN